MAPARRKLKQPRARKVPQTVLLTGITQGAGQTVSVPFGVGKSTKRKAPKRRKSNGMSLNGLWDAFHPSHLALPRAVAPYSVIRTTAIWNPTTDDQRRLVLFGPGQSSGHDGGKWANTYAFGANVPLAQLKSTTNGAYIWRFATMDSDSWAAASVVPAAFSIQVMNPEALQGTTGAIYIGRCKNKVAMNDQDLSKSFESLADELVSYSNPRLCTAGKLALRGVQIDAVPNNMSELAKFTTLERLTSTPISLASIRSDHQDGFNPIFIYNPNAVDIQVLVCCEWRVRFDPSNPAYASCASHRPSSEQTWAAMIERAVAEGAGVIDIVEKVARYGLPIVRAGRNMLEM